MKYIFLFLIVYSGFTFSQKDTIFLMDDTWKAGTIGKGYWGYYKIYTDSGEVKISDIDIDKIKFSDGRYIKLEHETPEYYALYIGMAAAIIIFLALAAKSL
jgi:hypothetical protein